MADNIEKLIFKDNYLLKAEKSRASFWLKNLKEADKPNIISVISSIRKEDSGLYIIGSSLKGQKYDSIDFFIFDSEVNTFVSNHFSAESFSELKDHLSRYAISRFSREFNKNVTVENKCYDHENLALIELSPKIGVNVKLFLPIIYNELKNSYQFYSGFKMFENEIGRKISSYPMLPIFKGSK